MSANGGRAYHAVTFYWEGYTPHLLLYSLKERVIEELDLTSLSIGISDEQMCTGSFRGEMYRPCPFRRHVEGFDQCEFCSRTLIPIQKCLFDPICDGEICGWDLCRREHSVYIAFYGEKAKVGMTSSVRISERLIEQGADAYIVAGTFPSRRAAREMEKRIGSGLGIPQTHRYIEILDELQFAPNFSLIDERASVISSVLWEKFGLSPSPVTRLEGYPIAQPLDGKPVYTDVTGFHEGRIVGVKGKVILYRKDGIKALNIAAVPSRIVHVL